MSNRVSISLPEKTLDRFNKIPEGSRSAVVRNLLEGYFRAYDIDAKIFDAVLRDFILVEELIAGDPI